ncbi:hypothetical protein FRC12_005069 [Ceratobasidium sp. 428]|nr:hypothetical protein FRC12_005069 [Ceratobasidium sp. 428]
MSGQGDAGMSESIIGAPTQTAPAQARTVEEFWVHMVAMEKSMRELVRMREEDQALLQRLENRIDKLTGHREEETDAKPSGSGKGKEREPEREPKSSDTPGGDPPTRNRHSGPKVKIPDAYNGKTKGKAAKQWWVRMMVAQSLMDDKFESEHQKLLWVLNNMEDKAADWALPLLMNLSSEDPELPATRSLGTLGWAFITSFGDPDAERAAERKITSLEQTTSTAEYTTDFQALAADLDWNDKAFMAQYRREPHQNSGQN